MPVTLSTRLATSCQRGGGRTYLRAVVDVPGPITGSRALGTAIKKARVGQRLTVREAAAAMGLSERTYARLEAGTRGLDSVGEIISITRAFGLEESAFDGFRDASLEVEPEAPAAESRVETAAERLEREVAALRLEVHENRQLLGRALELLELMVVTTQEERRAAIAHAPGEDEAGRQRRLREGLAALAAASSHRNAPAA